MSKRLCSSGEQQKLDQTIKWNDVGGFTADGGLMEYNWEEIIKARLVKFGEAALPVKSGFNPIGIEEEEARRLAEACSWWVAFESAHYPGGVTLPMVIFYPGGLAIEMRKKEGGEDESTG